MRRSSKALERPLTGEVSVPGDKSITHRAMILASLARGRSVIAAPNTGEDVASTASMLRGLGIDCTVDRDKAQAQVETSGTAGMREPSSILDAGNSGTSLRLL